MGSLNPLAQIIFSRHPVSVLYISPKALPYFTTNKAGLWHFFNSVMSIIRRHQNDLLEQPQQSIHHQSITVNWTYPLVRKQQLTHNLQRQHRWCSQTWQREWENPGSRSGEVEAYLVRRIKSDSNAMIRHKCVCYHRDLFTFICFLFCYYLRRFFFPI